MPEPITNGGETTPTTPTTPPQFNDEAKTYIQSLIEERVSRQNASHQRELDRIKAEHDAALNAERERHKTKPTGEGTSTEEAEKAQYKAILEAEKQRTAAVQAALEAATAKMKDIEGTNFKILKDVALNKAIVEQDTFNFVDIDVVKTLTDRYVSFDADSGTYIVKDDSGVVRQNDSLKPMSLKEFYADFGTKHPYLVASKVKGGTGAGDSSRTIAGGLKQVGTKSDLKDFKDKSEYIKKFGLSAYEALPLK